MENAQSGVRPTLIELLFIVPCKFAALEMSADKVLGKSKIAIFRS